MDPRLQAEPIEAGESLAPHRVRASLVQLRALYRHADAAYAPFSCPASGECCQLSTTRREPWLWLPEWLMLEAHLRQAGRALPPDREDGGCPFLDATGKRCSVYADRPFGCRTFFCGRKRGPKHEPLEAVVTLSRKLEALSQELDPELTAPLPLTQWINRARE